jgi:hypothetical protein
MTLPLSVGLDLPRSERREILVQAAVNDTSWMQEQLSERDWEVCALSALRARLARGERDAVRLYFELRKMVGSQESVLQLALQALGVSLEVAQKAVGLYRSAEAVDDAALIEYSRDLLERNGWTCLAPEKALSLPSLPVEATEPGHQAPLPRSNGKAS